MNVTHRDGLYLVIIIDISVHLGHPLSRRRWMFFGQAHSTTLNGVLFEVYCTFLAYILADYYRRQYPVRGGMPRTFRLIRNYWNQPLGEYG
jgi:hypothetical protein